MSFCGGGVSPPWDPFIRNRTRGKLVLRCIDPSPQKCEHHVDEVFDAERYFADIAFARDGGRVFVKELLRSSFLKNPEEEL